MQQVILSTVSLSGECAGEESKTEMKIPFTLIPLLFLVITPHLNIFAETFPLPVGGDSVVGAVQHVNASAEETLVDIAREFDLGYDQIVKANPEVNRWVPGKGTKVLIPHHYILPGEVRRGIVLNIPELRMYFYPGNGKTPPDRVYTFPVSIGRMDWKTPLGATKVIRKDRDPAWHPPATIRAEHARDGEILPAVIPGGAPDNPLGRFALRLGFPGYLIHGVDERKTYGIGMRVTHGCIRMYPDDIASLFDMVATNTPVHLLDQPIRLGWSGERLLLAVNQPLDEGEDEEAPEIPRVSGNDVWRVLREQIQEPLRFDEEMIDAITDAGDGIPREIARSQNRVEVRDIGVPQAIVEEQPSEILLSTPTAKPKSSLDYRYDDALSKYLGSSEKPIPTPTPAILKEALPGEAQRRNYNHYRSGERGSTSDIRRRIEDKY